ncbi:hypothetical protein J1605_021897 [Eschrichtius robustus]|uniref:Uncharacterized protein n=1 Tax=Eschrichtius robustus TaxID=9764 RepID=A0AB34HEF0_ESCRO|nr:hypothetical protein J1605_021897 [Eschrichtius robustus]
MSNSVKWCLKLKLDDMSDGNKTTFCGGRSCRAARGGRPRGNYSPQKAPRRWGGGGAEAWRAPRRCERKSWNFEEVVDAESDSAAGVRGCGRRGPPETTPGLRAISLEQVCRAAREPRAVGWK